MNFNTSLLQSLKSQKFETPTEIQKQAIPIIMEGHDLLATAETGSGKTLAFVTPALDLLTREPAHKTGRGPRVIILSPTRELANQIADCTKKLCKQLPYNYGIITGGVPYFNQEKMLENTLDYLIATPGRLIDHSNQGRVDYSRVELLVLDEADRMLDMGFRKDVEFILDSIPSERQILLFSATFDGDLKSIANRFLKNPKRIELSVQRAPHALISQEIYQTNDGRHKIALLQHLLESSGLWQAIVFTRTKRGAEKLANDLFSNKILCAPLHGDMKQSKRTKTLAQMHKGQIKALIATDVAARGIDVKGLSHVINYDLPMSPDDYIHRIGRTGRCGETGVAISFVGPDDWNLLAQIERHTGQRLERKIIPGLEPKQAEPKGKAWGGQSKQGKSRQGRPGEGRSRGNSSRSNGRFSDASNGRSKDASNSRSRNAWSGRSRNTSSDRSRNTSSNESRAWGSNPRSNDRSKDKSIRSTRSSKPTKLTNFETDSKFSRFKSKKSFNEKIINSNDQQNTKFRPKFKNAKPSQSRSQSKNQSRSSRPSFREG